MHESLAEAGNLTRMRALRGKAVLIVLLPELFHSLHYCRE